jgi:hypothetical protein
MAARKKGRAKSVRYQSLIGALGRVAPPGKHAGEQQQTEDRPPFARV